MVASQRFVKMFTPKNWWKMNPFWVAHTLSDGWFNHQPSDLVTCSSTNSSSLWALGFRWNSWRGICVRERSTFWNKRSKPWRWQDGWKLVKLGKAAGSTASFFEFVGFPLKSFPQRGNYFFVRYFFLGYHPDSEWFQSMILRTRKNTLNRDSENTCVPRFLEEFAKFTDIDLFNMDILWPYVVLYIEYLWNADFVGGKIKLFPSRKLLLTLAQKICRGKIFQDYCTSMYVPVSVQITSQSFTAEWSPLTRWWRKGFIPQNAQENSGLELTYSNLPRFSHIFSQIHWWRLPHLPNLEVTMFGRLRIAAGQQWNRSPSVCEDVAEKWKLHWLGDWVTATSNPMESGPDDLRWPNKLERTKQR